MDKSWYAFKTKSRTEKKVRELLNEESIENYLPTRIVLRQWSDRKKKIEMPVINGYIFANIPYSEIINVLKTTGIVSVIREKGRAIAIPDNQIETLRKMVNYDECAVEFSSSNLAVGDTVEVINGILIGTIGKLIEVKGKHRLQISINGMGYASALIPIGYVKKIKN